MGGTPARVGCWWHGAGAMLSSDRARVVGPSMARLPSKNRCYMPSSVPYVIAIIGKHKADIGLAQVQVFAHCALAVVFQNVLPHFGTGIEPSIFMPVRWPWTGARVLDTQVSVCQCCPAPVYPNAAQHMHGLLGVWLG